MNLSRYKVTHKAQIETVTEYHLTTISVINISEEDRKQLDNCNELIEYMRKKIDEMVHLDLEKILGSIPEPSTFNPTPKPTTKGVLNIFNANIT